MSKAEDDLDDARTALDVLKERKADAKRAIREILTGLGSNPDLHRAMESIDDTLADLSAFGVLQGRTAWLTAGIDADDLVAAVDAQDSVGQGVAEIGDEQVYIKTFDAATNAITFSPDCSTMRCTCPFAFALVSVIGPMVRPPVGAL